MSSGVKIHETTYCRACKINTQNDAVVPLCPRCRMVEIGLRSMSAADRIELLRYVNRPEGDWPKRPETAPW